MSPEKLSRMYKATSIYVGSMNNNKVHLIILGGCILVFIYYWFLLFNFSLVKNELYI